MAELLRVLVVHAVDPNPIPSTHTAVTASVTPVPSFGLLRTRHTSDVQTSIYAGTSPQLHVYMKETSVPLPHLLPFFQQSSCLS